MGVAFAPTPPSRVTRWLRRNLFRTPLDGAVTVVGGALAVYVIYRLARFVLVSGRWDVIRENLKLFMVGRYPTNHLPRVSVSVIVAALAAGLVAGIVHRRQVAAGTSTVVGMSPSRRTLDLLERFWPVLLGSVLVLSLTTTIGPTLTVLGIRLY